ncbi:uncharacterized protein ATC70_006914 [Mucor velutinosus]|uniref:Uncharacterized protein n=1 Tax=Mucor velutinosus TaxID=708070 RepID=A0AAN7DSH0_9FUNG|nr:hypothetical protein ATC70_006914 [Mucor velutinosus]
MIEVRNRLARLETAHVEIERLKTAWQSLKLLVTLSKPNLQLATVLQLAWLPNHHHPTHLLPLLPPQQHQHQLHAPMLPLPPLRFQEINHLLLPSLHLIQVQSVRRSPAARPPPPSATKASATLARLFAPQSDIPSGYQFVYYATPVRRRLSELRRPCTRRRIE